MRFPASALGIPRVDRFTSTLGTDSRDGLLLLEDREEEHPPTSPTTSALATCSLDTLPNLARATSRNFQRVIIIL